MLFKGWQPLISAHMYLFPLLQSRLFSPKANSHHSIVESTDSGWFVFRHPSHEASRKPPKALLPPDVLAQCAESRRQRLVTNRLAAQALGTYSTTPPQSNEKENTMGTPSRKVSGQTPMKISGAPLRASEHTPTGAGLATPGSLRRRMAKRASSGLALRAPLFSSPSESETKPHTSATAVTAAVTTMAAAPVPLAPGLSAYTAVQAAVTAAPGAAPGAARLAVETATNRVAATVSYMSLATHSTHNAQHSHTAQSSHTAQHSHTAQSSHTVLASLAHGSSLMPAASHTVLPSGPGRAVRVNPELDEEEELNQLLAAHNSKVPRHSHCYMYQFTLCHMLSNPQS